MFELNEEARRSTWVRQGDASWYKVGWHAKVEQVVFHAPLPVGVVPVVTRVWIGDAGWRRFAAPAPRRCRAVYPEGMLRPVNRYWRESHFAASVWV
jgi:hypothetical protein